MDSVETRTDQGPMELGNQLSSMSLHADGRESVSATPRIPQDLWPNIVSQLAFESLENVMFTCRYLRTLAQPLFFRTLAARHVEVGQRWRSPPPHVYGRAADDEKWILDKLQFYSSDSVSRHVQSCRIAPRQHLEESSLGLYEDDGRKIVDEIFSLMPTFFNLTSIYLEWVRFTHENLVQLARVSSLERAVFISCELIGGYSPVYLSIKCVLVNAFHPIHYQPLISRVINPDIIESLCVLRNVALTTVANPKPYRHLQALCIDVTYSDLSAFVTFLEEVPNLRELIFYNTRTPMANFPAILSHAIPHLESFEGPIEWAHNFTGSRTIRHLNVWPLDLTSQDLPFRFRSHLANNLDGFVESLTLKIRTLDDIFLYTIFERSPNLKALEIRSDKIDTKVSPLEKS